MVSFNGGSSERGMLFNPIFNASIWVDANTAVKYSKAGSKAALHMER